MKKASSNGTGLYAHFVKACKAGRAPWALPWERDAFIPWARDLATWKPEIRKDADLTGQGLEAEEVEAEAVNAETAA